jgi:hypothetical protein
MQAAWSIVGGIASILGATVAIWQAYSARRAASEAKRVRDQFAALRRTEDLAELRSHCRRAQNALMKYGPASADSSLRGVDFQADAQVVQKAVVFAKEQRGTFKSTYASEVDLFYEKAQRLLQQFTEAGAVAARKAYGGQILEHLSRFLALIKQAIDGQAMPSG